jgi:hypothetical protein
MITRNRIIGACLLGMGLGSVGFAYAVKDDTEAQAPTKASAPAATPPRAATPAPAPRPRPVVQPPTPVATWRPFQCVNRQTGQIQVDIPEARAQFLRRQGDRSYWKVVTPKTTSEFNINPTTVVCSYTR